MQEYTPDITDTSLRGLPLYYADFDKEYNTATSAGLLSWLRHYQTLIIQ